MPCHCYLPIKFGNFHFLIIILWTGNVHSSSGWTSGTWDCWISTDGRPIGRTFSSFMGSTARIPRTLCRSYEMVSIIYFLNTIIFNSPQGHLYIHHLHVVLNLPVIIHKFHFSFACRFICQLHPSTLSAGKCHSVSSMVCLYYECWCGVFIEVFVWPYVCCLSWQCNLVKFIREKGTVTTIEKYLTA